MNEVIFGQDDLSDVSDNHSEQDVQQTSKDVLNHLNEYLNNLQYKVFVALNNYHTAKQEWPTYRELAEFMDEPKNNVQPRLKALRDKQLVKVTDKKKCSVSDHNRKISQFEAVKKP